MRAIGLAIILLIGAAGGVARAQVATQPRPYDGIQAGLDAFRLAEEQRQAAIAMQLDLNDQMRARSGLPPSRGTTILYGYPANLDYAYAYGPFAYGPGAAWPRRTVFEPWPLVPGDIYGWTYVPPLRQPIGQWQGQTGPRRWESHPVYDPPLPDFQPLPRVEWPPAEPPVTDPIPPPPPPVRRGPREY